MNLAMIPARIGSKRLARKNLRELGNVPLIVHAIRRCRAAGVFDEIWVNSEHPDFGDIAAAEGVRFHRRPESLGNNGGTSEQYIAEFLETQSCDRLFQVHSIAPHRLRIVLGRDILPQLGSASPLARDPAPARSPMSGPDSARSGRLGS